MPTLPPLLHRIAAVLVAGLVLASAAPATAQDLPAWRHTSVNDFAGLLTPDDTRSIDQALIALNQDTGVEGTVVTLTDRARHGGQDGLESFATRLFNHWGVGDKDRNDGFMILVLPGDREARIELGRGYSRGAEIRAQDIMSRIMVPAFRDGDFSRGTRDGTLAVIDHIARPQADGQPVRGHDRWGDVGPFAIFLSIAGSIAGLSLLRRRRRNRCPQCGHQGLDRAYGDPLREGRDDGGWITSAREVTESCPACGWQRQRTVPLPVVSYYGPDGRLERTRSVSQGGGSSGFGGGSSSGGGASGRW